MMVEKEPFVLSKGHNLIKIVVSLKKLNSLNRLLHREGSEYKNPSDKSTFNP